MIHFTTYFHSIAARLSLLIGLLSFSISAYTQEVPASCHRGYDLNDRLSDINMLMSDTATYTRDYWADGALVIDSDTLAISFRGRGHSTFRQPKHPYALKLHKPASLLGMPAHSRWVLLANFFDHALMRNALALEVARQTSLAPFTSQGRFVRLLVNGQSQGLYYLCERVKDCVSDSLIHIDAYQRDEQTAQGITPDSIPWSMAIDTLSFIDDYLIHELCMNAEPNGPRSCYFHTNGQKLQAGPVWDFDMAFNPVGVDDGGDLRPTRFLAPESRPQWLQGKVITWFDVSTFYDNKTPIFRPLLSDRHFIEMLKIRWKELKPRFSSLLDFIDSCDSLIRAEAIIDQQTWNHIEPARFDSATDYPSAFLKLRTTYMQRIDHLDHLIDSL